MLRKNIYILVFYLLNFIRLQANGVNKVVFTQSDFISNISNQVRHPERSTKWKKLLTLLQEYKAGDDTDEVLKDIKKLRGNLLRLKRSKGSKNTKIYQILRAALSIVDSYLELECDLCATSLKEMDDKQNYLITLKCKKKCCYQCLFSQYIHHDTKNKKSDTNHLCPWCRSPFSKELKMLLTKDKRYKKLHNQAMEKKKSEQEKEDADEANRLYLQQLRDLQEGRVYLYDNESDNSASEEESNDSYDSGSDY